MNHIYEITNDETKEVKSEAVKVAEHKDINDVAQTVTVPTPPPTETVTTGDNEFLLYGGFGALGLAAVLLAILFYRKRRNALAR